MLRESHGEKTGKPTIFQLQNIDRSQTYINYFFAGKPTKLSLILDEIMQIFYIILRDT